MFKTYILFYPLTCAKLVTKIHTQKLHLHKFLPPLLFRLYVLLCCIDLLYPFKDLFNVHTD